MMAWLDTRHEQLIYGLGWGEKITLTRDRQRDYILEWITEEETE